MNGEQIRPIVAASTRTVSVFSLKSGTRVDLKPGDKVDGFVNEHGNVYTSDGDYVGSIGSGFVEVTQ